MSILADWEIRALCVRDDFRICISPNIATQATVKGIGAEGKPMIDPYDDGEKKPGKISSGESSYGYDIRLGTKFKVFTNVHGGVIDPKNKRPKHLFDIDVGSEGHADIPPHAFVLAESVERFHMPDNVIGVVLGKSTYARCSLIVNCTPIEAGWEGVLTIELTNPAPLPLRLYCGEGVAQVLFFQGKPCERPYDKRSGTYQNQEGLTLARVAKE